MPQTKEATVNGMEPPRLARVTECLHEALWPLAVAAACAVLVGWLQQADGANVPPWGATWGALAVVFAYLAVLPLLRIWPGVLVTAALFAACLGARWAVGQFLAVPALALLAGHYTLLAQRAAHAEAAEAGGASSSPPGGDRLLALARQGQGRLDAAFEHLRQLPAQGDVLDDLYYLGKGFERRRAYSEARAVFAHLVAHAPTHRNAAAHLKRVTRLAEVAAHAQALSPAASSVQGAASNPTRLGRYEVEGELGRGSMGKVYAGRDPVIGRVVALKTLALGSEFEGDALVDARERFFREAQSAGRLQHPHIVAIYDAGDDEGLVWIAMERLQGRDLSQFSQPTNLLAVPAAVEIAAHVAEALDYAHRHQVVHRDIKPSNILYNPATGSVKVTDFGIARIAGNTRTRTGLVLGTPSFMAPEQIAGQKVDGRCDIYALGVTLYQLLTGSLPLRGDSMAALMQAIAHEVPPDVRNLRAELPASIAQIVARALDKNPGARFQTGRQMADALRSALDEPNTPASLRTEGRLDYDARTDFHEHPMADQKDTVSGSADAPAKLRAAPLRN